MRAVLKTFEWSLRRASGSPEEAGVVLPASAKLRGQLRHRDPVSALIPTPESVDGTFQARGIDGALVGVLAHEVDDVFARQAAKDQDVQQ